MSETKKIAPASIKNTGQMFQRHEQNLYNVKDCSCGPPSVCFSIKRNAKIQSKIVPYIQNSLLTF